MEDTYLDDKDGNALPVSEQVDKYVAFPGGIPKIIIIFCKGLERVMYYLDAKRIADQLRQRVEQAEQHAEQERQRAERAERLLEELKKQKS